MRVNLWERPLARVYLLLRKLISNITTHDPRTLQNPDQQHPTQDEANREKWVVFIDTNPGFSIYTKLAILGAEQLIIPFMPDEFSIESFNSVLLNLSF